MTDADLAAYRRQALAQEEAKFAQAPQSDPGDENDFKRADGLPPDAYPAAWLGDYVNEDEDEPCICAACELERRGLKLKVQARTPNSLHHANSLGTHVSLSHWGPFKE